jgi:uncharacterized protein (TIGR03118 family)
VVKRSLIFGVPRAAALAAVALAATAFGVAQLAASTAAAPRNSFVTHNLVSDQAGKADHVDPNLVNAWGLASRVDSPWWVADNGTNRATVYTAEGAAFAPSGSALVVNVPNAPTGVVANSGSSFAISAGAASGPALFLFATEEGKILGWNQAIPPAQAVLASDRSGAGAIYKGLAINGDRLYATDFHNGRVDMFDGSFKLISAPGAFVDRKLPRGFAPFGIQAIGGRLFVTYAKQDAKREDDVDGQGLGFVDAFDRNGKLLARVARRGELNAPWGIARAPGNFGRFSGDLLIGNFGDGTINAYRQRSGRAYTHVGELRAGNGKPLVIDGLWALQFGHGAANNGPARTLFFTAGPADEAHGRFGTITAG